MLKQIHVYDLDGVLVDTSHRYRNTPEGTIDLAYWLENRTAKAMKKDRVLPLAKQYQADVRNPEIYTVICTAREYHTLDIAWIWGFLGAPDKLIMRPEKDDRPDAELKAAKLGSLFSLKQFSKLPRKFWDDNPRNLHGCRHLFDEMFHIHSHISGVDGNA
jgi:hypothetical protein